jgi:hypothetical protein
MRTQWLVSISLCAAAVVASTAASAAPARSGQSRDNAIRECVAQAKAAEPRDQILSGAAAGPGSAAMLTYKSCMQKKGLRP